MYRRDKETIVALRLPNMGLKVSGLKGEFQVVDGYALFWV